MSVPCDTCNSEAKNNAILSKHKKQKHKKTNVVVNHSDNQTNQNKTNSDVDEFAEKVNAFLQSANLFG